MCDRDAGKLWGLSLCGPTLFVARDTREVVGNEPTPAAKLPESIGIANTAVDWNGKRWTMVVWPLPKDAYARKVLLAHESFHRVQTALGFPLTAPSNAHLDTAEGRTLLQLEWRALAAALQAKGDARKRAISDALYFRQSRHVKFPGTAKDERELEMTEGLAEYSGTALAEPSVAARAPLVVKELREGEGKPTFVRSFAYVSGPAYGALLEALDPHWTRAAKATDDLATLLATRAGVAPSASVDAKAYDGVALRAAEQKRADEQAARQRAFQARFVDGPTLVLPLIAMKMQFDPNEVQTFAGHGNVYPTIHVTDAWGAIDVKRGGALIASDWKTMVVPRPPSDDYTLTLEDGWEVAEGTLRKAKP